MKNRANHIEEVGVSCDRLERRCSICQERGNADTLSTVTCDRQSHSE
jgi:hypothetical protein